VYLIDDVHLATPCGAQRGAGDKIAHGINAVIGSCVKFDDVKRSAVDHLHARITRTTWLTIAKVGAVQRLGKNSRS
jgi:hypothetical protein